MYRPALACLLLCALLSHVSLGSAAGFLGVVTESFKGHVGSAPVSAGATIYPGDRLSTEPDGRVWLRSNATQLALSGHSTATLQGQPGALSVNLLDGTLSFSTLHDGAIEVAALGADIRPAADAPANAEITIAGPNSLRIFARRGALKFSYGGESEIIAEGLRVRIVLDPSDPQKPSGVGSGPTPPELKKHRRFLIFLLVGGGAAAAAVWAVTRQQQESPDKP